MDLTKLTDEIINGKRLNRNEDLSFFETCDLDELCKNADKLREHFSGKTIDLCTIINARSGRCPENCKYCAQSSHHKTNCEVYSFLGEEKIFSEAKANAEEGVNRVALVTAGRKLDGEEFEKALNCYKKMNAELNIKLCASMGFLSREQFKRLREVGVTNYHDNIETSREYFSNICTTHTFEQKIEEIKMAQEEGFNVCSGGIIGMGESFKDRISMALTLSELKIKSIPINALMAIPGTPLENQPHLSSEEILRTIAMFRFVNPEAHIRLAAGRKLLGNNGKKAFESGASAMITGNMLTTSGSTIQMDKEMVASMDRKIEEK